VYIVRSRFGPFLCWDRSIGHFGGPEMFLSVRSFGQDRQVRIVYTCLQPNAGGGEHNRSDVWTSCQDFLSCKQRTSRKNILYALWIHSVTIYFNFVRLTTRFELL
jgi:hypothetical protein